jgi:hypothetical protein
VTGSTVERTLGYFDTSALMRWVESMVPTPDPRDARIAAAVTQLLQGDDRLGLSELTLMEFRASVSDDLRRPGQKAQMNMAWALRARESVMKLVADGRLELVPLPSHAFEHAMTLVDMVAGEHQMRPRTWDAIHLITACAWAEREGGRVSLYTSDSDFQEIMDPYPAFSRYADLVNLDAATLT